MKIEFTAFPRTLQGTGASRRLRGAGKVPGIVYGADKTAQAIELDHHALYRHLKMEAFHASILDMTYEGAKEQVLLRDVQMHPFKQLVLHVDFQRVDKNRKIHMKVPLHFINAELAPAVKTTDAIISHVLTELDVSCLPKDLPAFVEVDLSPLAVGQSIHVSDLKLPAGVTAVTRPGPSPVVATAVVPRIVVEVEEVAAPTAEAVAGEAAAAPAEGAKPGDKSAEKGGEKPAEKGADKAPAKKDDKK